MGAGVVRVRQYLVLKRNGNWFVKSLGRLGAPYSSKAKAIQVAIDRAKKNGKPANIALFIKHGEPKIIWTFGQDPYPPIILDFKLLSVRSTPS